MLTILHYSQSKACGGDFGKWRFLENLKNGRENHDRRGLTAWRPAVKVTFGRTSIWAGVVLHANVEHFSALTKVIWVTKFDCHGVRLHSERKDGARWGDCVESLGVCMIHTLVEMGGFEGGNGGFWFRAGWRIFFSELRISPKLACSGRLSVAQSRLPQVAALSDPCTMQGQRD